MKKDTQWNWQIANLDSGKLLFKHANGFENALRDGFFFVQQPEQLCLEAGDRFARSFYLDKSVGLEKIVDPFAGFQSWTEGNLGKYQGYFCRDVDQTEQFFLESTHWEKVFPNALLLQAEQMRSFTFNLLRAILSKLDLPEALWEQATGHCLTPKGTHTLTFNHFRPNIQARGLNIHKDSGWITVLRSLEPGLEVDCNGKWYPINPIQGTFIVNFGCAIEILMRNTRTPVAAVAHKVVHQRPQKNKPDRFSYAMFIDSSLDESLCEGLYQYDPIYGLQLYSKFSGFLDEILDNTYKLNTVGLY